MPTRETARSTARTAERHRPDGDDLAARDPALPALELVLRDRRLTRSVRRRWRADGPPPDDVHITYVRYKPATNIVAGLELRFPDGTVRMASLFGARSVEDPKLTKVRKRGVRVDRSLVVTSRRRAFVVVAAEADRRLPVATELPEAIARLVPPLTGAHVRPLAYKPLRRLVVRVDLHGVPAAVAKVHRDDAIGDVARVAAWVEEVARPAGLPLANPLGVDVATGLHVAAWRRGMPGDRRRVRDTTLASVGEQLARLHRLRPAGLPLHPPGELDVSALAAIAPHLTATADVVRRRLAARPPAGIAVPVHGDLSADQVVVGEGGRPTLLDLDRMHAGDPVQDLATWVAAEAVAHDLAGEIPVPPALLEAYHDAGGPADLTRLDAAIAEALLRRATDPFRLRMPGWPDRTARLVDAAAELTEEVGRWES